MSSWFPVPSITLSHSINPAGEETSPREENRRHRRQRFEEHYDSIELEEIVQVALLCTQYLPVTRPNMSEVVRMLEGDGLAERWEASQRLDSKYKTQELSLSERYSDLTDDSSVLAQAIEFSGPR